jgi:4-amino-4-deoxy-L-arabinose transferase-like glycosyltransferase/lipid-A-disaccharide synthase-like uncharacterized protein
MNSETWWLIIGFSGQGFFTLRFVVQWWQSERQRRSVIPIAFWYFSIAGALVLLVYSVHRADPVFILGQVAGLFIYGRNLYLIKAIQPIENDNPRDHQSVNWSRWIMTSKLFWHQWFLSPWTLLGGLWLLLVLLPLFNRTFLPIDETRYVAVAWEMWERGDWLVPYLNGSAYPHKPPLLFWLINLGWALFGVNDWWPRLLPGLFSLGSLALTVHLARQLWPQHPSVAQWAPFILLSSFLWSGFTSATMFDLVLAFFTLLGMIALVRAWQTPDIKAWGLLGIAIGFGVLTKGPVILLPLLPVALLAPWWQGVSPSRSWYLGILGSILFGTLIALVWAIPAGFAGGEEYRQAIFWGQTAHRLVHSFAHNRPFWWYLPMLPLILFPWLFWPPLWRGLLQLRQFFRTETPAEVSSPVNGNLGVRFCLIWIVLTVGGFSLISGKQLHYLLPLFPVVALLAAYLLVKLPVEQQHRHWDTLLPSFLIVLVGLALLIIPHLRATIPHLPSWVSHLSPVSSILLLLIGIGLIAGKSLTLQQRLLSLSVAAVLFNLIVPLTQLKAADPAYNLQGVSDYLSKLQRSGQTIAHLGKYHGEYQFLGRLQPLPVMDEFNLCAWLIKYPDSYLVTYFSEKDQGLMSHAEFVQPYRADYVGVIKSQMMRSVCITVVPLPGG